MKFNLKTGLLIGMIILFSGLVFADINDTFENESEEVEVVLNETIKINESFLELNESIEEIINESENSSEDDTNVSEVVSPNKTTTNGSVVDLGKVVDVGVIFTLLEFVKDSFDFALNGILKVSARLISENKTPIADQEISFFKNDVYVESGITDSDGYTYVEINSSNCENTSCILRAEFNGSVNLSSSFATYVLDLSSDDENVESNETNVSEEIILDDLMIFERAEFSDTYYLGNGKYKAVIYSEAVNMLDSNGEYKPYEEVTDFNFDGDSLILEWNNKSVEMHLYTKDSSDEKDEFKEKDLVEKDKLNFMTKIEKKRGSYYFDHTLDEANQPKKLGYDIKTKNVKCIAEGRALICDEQRIDFEEAFVKQGINVSVSKNNVEFEGDNLSYIDPEIGLNRDSFIPLRARCNQDTEIGGSEQYVGTLQTAAGYERRLVEIYDTSTIPDDAVVDEVKANGSFGQVNDWDCVGQVSVRFKKMDFDDADPEWYGNDVSDANAVWSAMSSHGEYTYINGIGDEDDNSNFNVDLGIAAVWKLEELLSTDESFVLGFAGNPSYSTCDDKRCDVEITSRNLIVTYTAYPLNASISVGDYPAWNYSGRLDEDIEADISDAINSYLADCTADDLGYCDVPVSFTSESAGIINVSGPEVYFDVSKYIWNSTGLFSEGAFLRILASDGLGNSSWTVVEIFREVARPFVKIFSPEDNYIDVDGIVDLSCYVNDTLGILNVSLYGDFNGSWGINGSQDFNNTEGTVSFNRVLNNGEYSWACGVYDNQGLSNISANFSLNVNTSLPLFEFRGNGSEVVAAFLGNGGLNLKGDCSISANCTAPQNSLIFQDTSNTTVAYIDSDGNICLESGSCNDNQTSCNPSEDAFIIQDGLGLNLSYVDFSGEMCLTGELNEEIYA
ncbi:hypothetical protein K8R30_04700 [archaeon]|nr:hypothetical protein [archaeon]